MYTYLGKSFDPIYAQYNHVTVFPKSCNPIGAGELRCKLVHTTVSIIASF